MKRFLPEKLLYFAVAIGVVSATFLIGTFIIRANIHKVNPTVCLGGWQNPVNAQGEASVAKNSEPEAFNTENSAVLSNAGAQIFCSGFSNEAIKDQKPQRILLSMSWAFKEHQATSSVHENVTFGTTTIVVSGVEATSTATTTISPEVVQAIINAPEDTTTQFQLTLSTSTADLASSSEPVTVPVVEVITETPEVSEIPPVVEEPPAPVVEPVPEVHIDTTTTNEQGGDLDADFLEMATSSVASTTDEIATSTESIPFNFENFLEVFYTLDGNEWSSLGKVSKTDFVERVFEIPAGVIPVGADISRLQIAIHTLPTIDALPDVYLDAMTLEVHYEGLSQQAQMVVSQEIKKEESPQFFDQTLLEIKSAAPFVAVKTADRNHRANIWFFNTENPEKTGYIFASDEAVDEDSIIGLKEGLLFWTLGHDTMYGFDLKKQMYLVQESSEKTSDGEYTFTFKDIPWIPVARAGKIYFHTKKTGEVGSDDDNATNKIFYEKYLKDLPKDREDLIQLHLVPPPMYHEESL